MTLLHYYKGSTNPGGNTDLIGDQAGSMNLLHAGGAGSGWWRDAPDSMLIGASPNWEAFPQSTPDFSGVPQFSFSFAGKYFDNAASANGMRFHFSWYSNTTGFPGWGFTSARVGQENIAVYDGVAWQIVSGLQSGDTDGNYHSYIVNWTNGGTVVVYRDGSELGSVTTAALPPPTVAFDQWGSKESIAYSYVDNIQVHDRHLTAQEIADHAANPREWVESPASGPPPVHPLSGFGHPLKRPGVIS